MYKLGGLNVTLTGKDYEAVDNNL